jgi:superfamily II DNA/RNA helicase
MKDPIYVTIEEQDPVADRISQTRFEVSDNQKIQLLKDILIVENPDSCMIFCNTQVKVDEVYNALSDQRFTCDKIHGGMEQRDRIRVMEDFKRGYFRYLVATDVAARGIDIDQISIVVNFDVPNNREGYVHRIGRTGRIGNMGKAITFVAPSEYKLLEDIHCFTGKEIPLGERPKQGVVLEAEEEFAKKLNAVPELKETKGTKLSEGIMKLHINAGKKTKMRASDIVGTLCGIDSMTTEDIGIINILDISTFVEILNHKGELVLQNLQQKPIKGRIRKVSMSDR